MLSSFVRKYSHARSYFQPAQPTDLSLHCIA
jgi:hypothetical protein